AALEVLAGRPLRPCPLPVARRGVVEHDVARYHVKRLVRRDVAATRADHDAELPLVVEPFGQGWPDQVGVWRQNAVGTAHERLRPGGYLPATLQRVLGVVHA